MQQQLQNAYYDIFVLYETKAMQAEFYCVAVAKIELNQLTLLRPLNWKNGWLRFVIAGNENTPAAVLVELNKDEDLYVRCAVAKNKI